MENKKILARLNIPSYKDYLLPLEEAQKVQSILANHSIGGVESEYSVNHRGARLTAVRRGELPRVLPIDHYELDTYVDTTMLSSDEYHEWVNTQKGNDKDAEVLDPKIWLNMRKNHE